MEKILRIEETAFKKDNDKWHTYEGFIIITDKQSIKIGVSNDQDCCERWGHFVSHDNLDDFIGAELHGVYLVDTALNEQKLKEHFEYGMDEDDNLMYVNLDTDRGILQFTVYNSHNGYYGHAAVVISEQLQHECTL